MDFFRIRLNRWQQQNNANFNWNSQLASILVYFNEIKFKQPKTEKSQFVLE